MSPGQRHDQSSRPRRPAGQANGASPDARLPSAYIHHQIANLDDVQTALAGSWLRQDNRPQLTHDARYRHRHILVQLGVDGDQRHNVGERLRLVDFLGREGIAGRHAIEEHDANVHPAINQWHGQQRLELEPLSPHRWGGIVGCDVAQSDRLSVGEHLGR